MKRILSVILLSSISSVSYAENEYYHWDNDSAMTIKMDKNNNISSGLLARISHSVDRKKRIYIERYYRKGDNYKDCFNLKEGAALGYSLYYIIEGQSVEMVGYCRENNDGYKYISATPATNRGLNFLINKLKANRYVKIKAISGMDSYVSAQGFIRAWNSPSNNPL